MATKNKKQEDIQTLDAVDEAATEATEESKVENSGDTGENEDGNTEAATSADGSTITLDDDSDIKPLAADDYVENFEVGGQTLAVRDVEAQDAITQLNSDMESLSTFKVISTSGVTYNTNYISSLTLYCYQMGQFVMYSGQVQSNGDVFCNTTNGAISNLPIHIKAGGKFYVPISSYGNGGASDCYVRIMDDDWFALYGNFKANGYYVFNIIGIMST